MNRTVRNILIRLTMLTGLIVFVFFVVMAKIHRDERTVRMIRVSVDEWNALFFINKQQVLNFVRTNFDIRDKVLTGEELERIEEAVNRIPQVRESSAYIDDQGNLNIRIIQRKPLARIYNLQGQSFYVDEDGVKFSTTDFYTAKVPVVSGVITESCDSTRPIESLQLKRIFNILRDVNNNTLWKEMIGQYNINDSGQVELVPRFGNAVILFGDDQDRAQKLKRLDIFYFDVLRKIGWDRYRVINIMYKDQVVCLK